MSGLSRSRDRGPVWVEFDDLTFFQLFYYGVGIGAGLLFVVLIASLVLGGLLWLISRL